MQTLLVILFVLAISAILVLVINKGFKRSASPPSQPARAPSSRPSAMNRYQAVSICAAGSHCEAVGAMGNERFLLKSSPHLPLPECDVDTCRCRYLRHEDRRDEEDDRRLSIVTDNDYYRLKGGSERREKRGRRNTDWAVA